MLLRPLDFDKAQGPAGLRHLRACELEVAVAMRRAPDPTGFWAQVHCMHARLLEASALASEHALSVPESTGGAATAAPIPAAAAADGPPPAPGRRGGLP